MNVLKRVGGECELDEGELEGFEIFPSSAEDMLQLPTGVNKRTTGRSNLICSSPSD
jgi:hypothetical protein